MTINPVQSNIDTQQRTYRDYKQPINTLNSVHPLPAEGHLVHDSLLSIPKFWLKDIAYDMKAVRDGFTGNAKDHQTGRLNDVGLKLSGIGIATYLASQTTDPKMRIMEYVGLGTFLACMQLYPTLAINVPSRLVHGFDIGKEYIDDQGRKKSVFQDGNYIPYDMYRGEYAGENLDIIGDRMGIPAGIKNRDELTKEQMRKIAIQNNTLWMLGAGFATPVMTALICSGMEKIISPAMEAIRDKKHNSNITKILNKTAEMSLDLEDIDSNSLSKKVEKFLMQYKNKELPVEELENLVKILSEGTDENLAAGIREDLNKLFTSEKKGFVLGDKSFEDLIKIIHESAIGRNNATFKNIFSLTEQEFKQALKNTGSDGRYISIDQIKDLKGELKRIFEKKIIESNGNRDALYMHENRILENMSKAMQRRPSLYISNNNIGYVTDLAKILGEFKENDKILYKAKSFKVEHAPETILARSYKKFENVIFEALDIKYGDLKQMKESEEFTKEILERKIQLLVNNEDKYSRIIKKLAKIMSETELRLHGNSETESYLKDLISAYENNYNNTAKRINNIGEGLFSKTINKMIKEDVNGELDNTVKTRQDLFDLIDGFKKPYMPKGSNYGERAMDTAQEMSKGVGSSKQLAITRIIDRIQGVENSQRRLLHTLDVYKRQVPADEYEKQLNKTVKKVLLEATSADHTLKLHTDNNPLYYKDLMRTGWENPLQETTKEAMGSVNNIKKGDVLKRFEKYIQRFKDIIGQNGVDFTKPDHRFGRAVQDFYRVESDTRAQKFNLVAQNPIDFFKKSAKTRFENQKWLRIASGIGGTVLAVTVLMQFGFGKVKNPHNIKKQVGDDTNI